MILIVSIILNILSLVAFIFYRRKGIETNNRDKLGGSVPPTTSSIPLGLSNTFTDTMTEDPCSWVEFLKNRKNQQQTFDQYLVENTLCNGIRIYNNAKGDQLTLAEVIVYGPKGRISTSSKDGASVTQSSTKYGRDATKAIDGNTDGLWENNSITYTENKKGQFWQLSFRPQIISYVDIYNRTGSKSVRLAGAKLYMYTGSGTVFFEETLRDARLQRIRVK